MNENFEQKKNKALNKTAVSHSVLTLSNYLKYDVKYYLPDTFIKRIEILSIDNFNYVMRNNYPLILRPISDVATEINSNKTFLHQICIDLGLLKDDNFIFQYDFSDSGSYGDKYDFSIISPTQNKIISIPQKTKDLKYLPHYIFEDLLKNNFDVFGLIEKGLAISIHDVE